MKSYILSLILCTVVLVGSVAPVAAQQYTSKKYTDHNATPAFGNNTYEGGPKLVEKKPLKIAPLASTGGAPIAGAAPVQQPAAPEPAPQQQAAAPQVTYYENCLKQKDQRFSATDQQQFCECTAQRVQPYLTPEFMNLMSQPTNEGKEAQNSILINVYAPCMQAPVASLMVENCKKTQNSLAQFQNLDGLCGCYGQNIGKALETMAPAIMQDALKANPNLRDPLNPILDSQAFKTKAQSILAQCLGQ